ncbi:MAG: hypothetical protein M1825_000020 [Sarcosagium campestre]|nr:MAG: hypothetical protein M1825_000020 [Sarcosagium campestre]
MSTAVAPAVSATLPAQSVDREVSPKSYPTMSSSISTPVIGGTQPNGLASAVTPNAAVTPPNPSSSGPDRSSSRSSTDGRSSPKNSRNGPPKIIVKKEPPTSPDLPTSRHRPRKLDLSKGSSAPNPTLTSRASGGPMTARDSSGLGMHDVGLACLSPGFSTQDPTMREQLQRSISVRDQQRHIIEARLQKTANPIEGEPSKQGERAQLGGLKTPSTSRRKPPPGLSIVAPSHEQFANERVIQSAPLHRSFPGRHQPEPMTRHVANQPSNLSQTSHIHHVPATQTSNRLPPITDVFASEKLSAHREAPSRNGIYNSNSTSNSSHSNSRPPFPSPGQVPRDPPNSSSATGRPRDYRSAEEAVASLSGGREELLPKIVHYGGHQPPTPPSPLPGSAVTSQRLAQPSSNGETTRTGGGRRRTRAEYERDMGSPPLGIGPGPRRGPFGEGRDSPDSQRKKKDEFLGLCSRAWDLFHN